MPDARPLPSARRPAPWLRALRAVFGATFGPVLRLVLGLVLGLAPAAVLPGCAVSIEDKSGTDPCNPNPCQKAGVCSGWVGTCSVKSGKAVCSAWQPTGKAPTGADGKPLTAPANYEATEASCDGQDNDCDGLVDEVTLDAAKVCAGQGVCAGVTAKAACAFGKVQCDWAAAPAFEASETTCDGQDNDCDGTVDEGVVPGPGDCKRQGVCAGLPTPACTDGAWQCFYAEAPDFEADGETKCDGKDNDCDGVADANLDPTALAGRNPGCLSQGVCASGVQVVCQGGQPTCAYAQVAGFEAVEKTCDAKDNDCDGGTDNFAGGAEPLVSADTAGCQTAGVCGGAGASFVHKVCQGGQFQCSYAAVPGFEASEATCDAKDNDCDGGVDEQLPAPAKSPCGTLGVCAQGTAQCSEALWTCDFAALGAQGYEAFEQTCDGKDNDCDGKTDETLAPGAHGCKTQGVCGLGAKVACAAGQATCDYSGVPAYQDVTETLCDGFDNDCDGKTDEPEGLDPAPAGCLLGVCAGKAKTACSNGKWSCDTSGISGYQAQESSCDGLDNDCDGLTDEALTDPVAAKCPSAGVCAQGIAAACAGGSYVCSFAGVAGYEVKEATCDGLDNDCDGKTDTGVCAAGTACTADAQCASGSCVAVTGGTGKTCAAKAGQCAHVDDAGKIALVDEGGAICSGSTASATCSKGAFAAAQACPIDAPTCIAGACVVCAPDSTACDPDDPTQFFQCSADGKALQAAGSCPAGNHCAGAGQCVADAPFALSDAGSGGLPVAQRLAGGGVAVAWISDGPPAEVRVRILDATGKPVGASLSASGALAPVKTVPLTIAPVGTGFALAWVTATTSDNDVALRLFDATGQGLAPAFVPYAASGSEQTDPALGGNGTTLVLAFASDDLDGDGKGIGLQRFDATGQEIGSLSIPNNDPTAFGDVPTAGEQVRPAVAVRPSGDFAVVWTHLGGLTAKHRIRGRAFGPDGAAKEGVLTLSTGNVHQQSPAIAWGKSELVVAWTADGVDGAGTGIALRRYDAAFKPLATQVVANTLTGGDQDDVRMAVQADGTVVLVWRSNAVLSAEDGAEVSSRDIAPGGAFLGDENVVTKAAPAGEQDQPRAVTFADGRVLYVWRHRAQAASPGAITAMFR